MNIKHNKTGFTYASGFTLIELMLAMLIGLIIMGGVMQMFITTRDTQRTSEEQMQLVADARFVLDTISYDLRHAGLWGGTNESNLIICGRATATTFTCPPADDPGNAVNDCSGNDWYRDLARPVLASNNLNPFAGTCATQGYQPGTDVLGLHYADSLPIPTGAVAGEEGALAGGVIYVRSNILGGQIFAGNTYPATSIVPKWIDNPIDSRTKNYTLRSPVYYVSDYTNAVGDGVPSLHRVELIAGPEMDDQVLIPGVENLQFEFGVDTTGDFQVDTYMNAANVTLGGYWTTGDVIAVKISLLMRAITPDRDGIGGTQTYTLAGGTAAGGATVTFADGVHRFLMTRIVRLRNTTRRDLSKAGV